MTGVQTTSPASSAASSTSRPIAHCGTVSALTLGLPSSSAVPEAKSALPKALFVGRAQISAKLRQRLTNDIAGITMLALLRPANTALAAGERIPEILVIGLRLAPKSTTVPSEVINLIAAQRKSGIVFVVVRDAPHEGTVREECTLAVRRVLPGKAGHLPVHEVFAAEWKPAGEVALDMTGGSLDELWDSICSQIIFDDASPDALDDRISRRAQIRQLEMSVDKLTRDHQRTKDVDQRNELYAKLHKAKQQLEQLRAESD